MTNPQSVDEGKVDVLAVMDHMIRMYEIEYCGRFYTAHKARATVAELIEENSRLRFAVKQACTSIDQLTPIVENMPCAVILKGNQGEPAGPMTVYIVYSNGDKIPVIETQANLINHCVKIPAASSRAGSTA